ncbi:hypothetical protein LXA43DRAFT_1069952, partial [Ganoderma leucocontextum]
MPLLRTDSDAALWAQFPSQEHDYAALSEEVAAGRLSYTTAIDVHQSTQFATDDSPHDAVIADGGSPPCQLMEDVVPAVTSPACTPTSRPADDQVMRTSSPSTSALAHEHFAELSLIIESTDNDDMKVPEQFSDENFLFPHLCAAFDDLSKAFKECRAEYKGWAPKFLPKTQNFMSHPVTLHILGSLTNLDRGENRPVNYLCAAGLPLGTVLCCGRIIAKSETVTDCFYRLSDGTGEVTVRSTLESGFMKSREFPRIGEVVLIFGVPAFQYSFGCREVVVFTSQCAQSTLSSVIALHIDYAQALHSSIHQAFTWRRIQILHVAVESVAAASSRALLVWQETADRDDVDGPLLESAVQVLKTVLQQWHEDNPFTPVNMIHLTRLVLIDLFDRALANAQLLALAAEIAIDARWLAEFIDEEDVLMWYYTPAIVVYRI